MWNLKQVQRCSLLFSLAISLAMLTAGCGSSDECLDPEGFDLCSLYAYKDVDLTCDYAEQGFIPQSECDLEIKYADDAVERCEIRYCTGRED